jgi:apolipoprotein N-acyltransferase
MNQLSSPQRIILGIALATLSAACLALSFPPYGLWPLVWIAFMPMLLAQYRVLPRRLTSLAPSIAIGGWFRAYLIPIFGAYGSFMTFLPLIIAAIPLMADRPLRAFHERSGYRWFVVRGAAGWVGIELVRSFIPVMGTWGFVAYPLYEQAWLLQPVSIFGIYGMNLLILLVNYTLGLLLLGQFDRRWCMDAHVSSLPAHLVRRWLLITGAALLIWTGLSLGLFTTAPGQSDPAVRVAALHYDAGRPRGLGMQKFVEQTYQASGLGAQIIVWPEMAISFDPQVEQAAAFQSLANDTGAYLAVGYFVRTSEQTHRNEATVISPTGSFLGVFGKDHPVVFNGERGTSLGVYPVYDTPHGKLATIICYDLNFTDTSRRMAQQGAQIIAVPSLDAPEIADKHYTHLVLRAIENRVVMIKSDSSGSDSAIIDSYGRILTKAVTPEGGETVLVADVHPGTGRAPTVLLGDWVGWLCLAGIVFFGLPFKCWSTRDSP